MEQFWIVSAIILAVVYYCDKNVVRFELKAYATFLKCLLIGTALSIVLNSLLARFPPLAPVGVSSLFMVWWEDVMFSLLLIYYAEKFLPKWIFVPIVVLSSLIFGAGHLYQGYFVAALLSLYPYFVSYKYGKKYGYGTVMLCHITYDLSIVGALYLAQFIRSF